MLLRLAAGVASMGRIEEYQSQAMQLRAMAAKERNQTIKDTMLGLAQQWEELALARQEFLLMRAQIESGKKPN